MEIGPFDMQIMSLWKRVNEISLDLLQRNDDDIKCDLSEMCDILHSTVTTRTCSPCVEGTCCRFNDTDPCQCLILFCLTTCNTYLRHHTTKKVKLKLSDDVAVKFLHNLVLLLDKDKFIKYMAQKTLVSALQHQSFEDKNEELFGTLVEELLNSQADDCTKARLELFGYFLSDTVKRNIRENVLKVLCKNWNAQFDKYCSPEKNKNDFILYEILQVWQKLSKLFTTNEYFFQLSESNEIIFQKCFSLIDLLNLNTKDIISNKIIHVFNTMFSYGNILSTTKNINPVFMKLGIRMVEWTDTVKFQHLIIEQNLWFGGSTQYIQENEKDLSMTRVVSLLCLKVCAVLLKFKQETSLWNIEQLLLEKLIRVDKMVTQRISCKRSFDWLYVVFCDQDDDWIEALLTLLDIYLYGCKCWNSEQKDTKYQDVINPHQHFVTFICTLDYDHSVLLDWLTSPETCFLQYLTRYVRLVTLDWKGFKTAVFKYESEDYVPKQIQTGDQNIHPLFVSKEVLMEDKKYTETNKVVDFNETDFKKTVLKSEIDFKFGSDVVYSEDFNNCQHEMTLDDRAPQLDQCLAEISKGMDNGLPGNPLISKERNTNEIEQVGKPKVSTTLGLSLICSYDDDVEEEEEEEGCSDFDSKEETYRDTFPSSQTLTSSARDETYLNILHDHKCDVLGGNILHGHKCDGLDGDFLHGHKCDSLGGNILENIYLDKKFDRMDNNVISSNCPDNTCNNGGGGKSYLPLEQSLPFHLDAQSHNDEMDEDTSNNEVAEFTSDNEIISDNTDSDVSLDRYSQIMNSLQGNLNNTPSSDNLLDRIMAMLIRLRLKVSALWDSNLFPYNPAPLVSLIEQCEYLYESPS